MIYRKVALILAPILLAAGCQNEELIQCQQDKTHLETELQDLQQQAGGTGEMLALVLDKNKACQDELAALRTDLGNTHQAQQKELECARKAQARARKEAQRLQQQFTELQDQLDQSRKQLENAFDLLSAKTAEVEQLKARMAEIEAQLADQPSDAGP